MRTNALTHPHDIYRNLHNGKWSIVSRSSGRVVQHNHEVILSDVIFVVQKSGNAKVRKEKRKQVHAFVRGSVIETDSRTTSGVREHAPKFLSGPWTRIRYNPYEHTSFVAVTDEGEKPIKTASAVRLDADGTVWATNPS